MEGINNEIDYEIVLRFSSLSEAGYFLSELELWKEYKARRAVKILNDKRGQHTKTYHARARIHKMENPELSYNECMQYVRTNAV